MKRIVLFLVFILPAITVFSQDYPIFTIGLNSGYDHNFNAYKVRPSTQYNYSYYGIPDQYNIGINLGLAVNSKLRPRFEVRYVNSSFGIRYNYNVTGSNNTDLIKSIWNVNNFDLTLRLDYKLKTFFKKLDVYASPGIKYEYYVGDFIRTYTTDQPSLTSKFNFLEDAFPKSIAAGSFELFFKYNISKKIGITVFPEYTLFFRNYSVSNQKLYQRISIDGGFEFKL